ncbi:tRNA (guanosine(46)-N7)-methyltransferase TrmB [Mycolicibacterium brumae]|uniref:tRNA (guanosine(46)-N7)-methyltransferase TrmB n=1 Tax=Mycolicibacterium brumae TaxID=85968 RepID=UPI0035226C77
MGDDGGMHVRPGPEAAEKRPAHHRRVTSFRSRRSTLSDSQQATWQRRWPELGQQARTEDGTGFAPLDTADWFGRTAPLVLEVGCGTGISTLGMAQAEPDLDVIAVEVYKKGLAQLLSAIDRSDPPVTNIRLIRGDGLEVLQHLISPGSLTGVRVFFPDPWPKARHHKRRLLQPETLTLIADRLRPGGVLHAATDHADYAEHIAEIGAGHPLLCRVTDRHELATLPISVARPTTKYEAKAAEVGSAINEFIWVRV